VLLAHGKKRTLPRSQTILVGFLFFSTSSKKTETPQQKGA
jgi:hypothetical protein